MTKLPQEIIALKRDGKVLDAADIAAFVAGYTDGSISQAQTAAFAMAVYFQDMTVDERVALTCAMRDSGDVLDWSDLDGPIADKHSTGGIGDNTSLMLAPILAALGIYVPMISGRSLGHCGGTLDKLDAIPGYNSSPDLEGFRKTVRSVGCAIVGQTPTLVPADKKLYVIRDVTGTVESIPLIVSSILSKKLAAGLRSLVLDVKTGSGAFMQTRERAHALAQSMVDVANGAGLRTTALITDMNEPLAPTGGNGLEIRNAVEFLTGAKRDPRHLKVTLALCAQLIVMSGKAGSLADAEALALSVLNDGKAAEKFAQMVSSLGGPADLIEKLDSYLDEAPIVRDVFVADEGIVSAIDTRAVGMAIVSLGGGRLTPTDTVDHRVGFDGLMGLGTKIDAGTPIARIHARDEASALEGEKRLRAAYQIGNAYEPQPLIAEQINPS